MARRLLCGAGVLTLPWIALATLSAAPILRDPIVRDPIEPAYGRAGEVLHRRAITRRNAIAFEARVRAVRDDGVSSSGELSVVAVLRIDFEAVFAIAHDVHTEPPSHAERARRARCDAIGSDAVDLLSRRKAEERWRALACEEAPR